MDLELSRLEITTIHSEKHQATWCDAQGELSAFGFSFGCSKPQTGLKHTARVGAARSTRAAVAWPFLHVAPRYEPRYGGQKS